jgi:predicted  nucleic acid-binding Zn-ribbon protein
MTDQHETAIGAARRRLREAEEKFDRQQRRYAMLALEGDKATAAARATLAEVEAELEASRDALRKLEADAPGRN